MPSPAKLIMLALARLGMVAQLSLKELATMTGYSRPTLCAHLSALEREGWLKVARPESSERGRGESSTYHLCVPGMTMPYDVPANAQVARGKAPYLGWESSFTTSGETPGQEMESSLPTSAVDMAPRARGSMPFKTPYSYSLGVSLFPASEASGLGLTETSPRAEAASPQPLASLAESDHPAQPPVSREITLAVAARPLPAPAARPADAPETGGEGVLALWELDSGAGEGAGAPRGSKPQVVPSNQKPKRKRATPTSDSPEFTKFWQAYPRKIGKGAARASWASHVVAAGVDPTEVITAAERLAAARQGQDPKFTPHPSTWLNQQRWEDTLDAEYQELNKAQQRNRDNLAAVVRTAETNGVNPMTLLAPDEAEQERLRREADEWMRAPLGTWSSSGNGRRGGAGALEGAGWGPR